MRGPRITELDITRFTEGDCHILAKVLNALIGWPMYTLHTGDNEPGMHAFVFSDGVTIDVYGARPMDALLCDWDMAQGIVETPEIDWGPAIFHGSWRRARTIAPLLIPAS
jgi:hypothetical protein